VSDAIPVLTDRKSLLSEDSLLERVIAAAEERQLFNSLIASTGAQSSLDRIEKDRGYIPGNVRLVCIRITKTCWRSKTPSAN
jgi:hypothetical protein